MKVEIYKDDSILEFLSLEQLNEIEKRIKEKEKIIEKAKEFVDLHSDEKVEIRIDIIKPYEWFQGRIYVLVSIFGCDVVAESFDDNLKEFDDLAIGEIKFER